MCRCLNVPAWVIAVALRACLAQLILSLPANAAGWSTAMPLADARTNMASALLPDGRLLVAGGVNSANGTLSSAFVYDYLTNSWRSAGNMSVGRESATATLLPSAKVLIAGGAEPVSGFLSSAELYDPAKKSWSDIGSMSFPRYGHTATLLSTGKVLVVGGSGGDLGYLSSAELYDPESNSWKPVASLPNARSFHTACLLPSGKVLVIGGIGTSLTPQPPVLYDPVANTWSGAGSMLQNRSQSTATLLPSGNVLVAGGYNDIAPYVLRSAELYHPATNTWSAARSMRDERGLHSATLLANGKVLVAGGQGITYGSFATYWASAELYDPATNAWSDAGTMSAPHPFPNATLLANGKVLVIGGRAADLYDPTPFIAPGIQAIPALNLAGLFFLSLVLLLTPFALAGLRRRDPLVDVGNRRRRSSP